MNWNLNATSYTADVETNFVKMRIFVDMPHTNGLADVRYEARVETIKGAGLASKDNIATVAEAQAWCELAYANLLSSELRELLAGLAHSGLDAQTLGSIALSID